MYEFRHPAGCARAWNVMYVGDNDQQLQLFLGHGFERPLTEEEINQMLIDLYNKEPTAHDLRFASANPGTMVNLKKTLNTFLASKHIKTNVDTLSRVDIQKYKLGTGYVAASPVYVKPEAVLHFLQASNVADFADRLLSSKYMWSLVNPV